MLHSTFLSDEASTEAFGAIVAEQSACRGLITLSGDLGAGKTTLCRGLIRAAGHAGSVKSPTFTLMEPYEIGDKRIMHFDLYRMEDSEELEFIGFRDYLEDDCLCLIEWPEKAARALPAADLEVFLRLQGSGREISWTANTPLGKRISAGLAARFI